MLPADQYKAFQVTMSKANQYLIYILFWNVYYFSWYYVIIWKHNGTYYCYRIVMKQSSHEGRNKHSKRVRETINMFFCFNLTATMAHHQPFSFPPASCRWRRRNVHSIDRWDGFISTVIGKLFPALSLSQRVIGFLQFLIQLITTTPIIMWVPIRNKKSSIKVLLYFNL